MAKKKTRVPTPPAPRTKGSSTAPPRRPVQAPKVRPKDRRTRPSGLMIAAAASGLVALIAVVGVILLTRGNGGSSGGRPSEEAVAAALQAAGCTYTQKPPLPFLPNHASVPTETSHVRWNTYPPAGGAHYQTPVIW